MRIVMSSPVGATVRESSIDGQTCMAENYDVAALVDTLIAEGATRLRVQSGTQPRIVDIPTESGVTSGVLDVAPVTTDGALALLRAIASPEQLRELELCGSARFIHIHSSGAVGITRVRVTAEIGHGVVRMELQYLGRAGS